jgi:putative peptidoglycan lipid II flippase|tara:strand:+ start:1347 stop:2621 length:1275 start_codon:yes stop_codon:yes gene_type:complete
VINSKSFLSKSLKDFSFLFSSNILKKILGFFRELVLAFLFGSSLIYASYLILKTITDFFSQFTFGNALQANLIPRFTKLFKDNTLLNLVDVKKFSNKILLLIFLISLIIQFLIISFIIKDYYLILSFIAVILSSILAANFYNSLFLSIIQAKGDFKKFSISTTLNICISTILVYPLSFLFDIIGIAISRLVGVISLSYIYIKPLTRPNQGLLVNLSIKDFQFSVIFLSNISLFILLLARFIIGLDASNQITFFNYSFILLNILLTSIVFNINTVFLRKLSLVKSLLPLLYSFLITLIISILLYVTVSKYSMIIVDFVYNRGAFNNSDVISTASFLLELTPGYIILMFVSIFFQPFFSLGLDKITNISNRFCIVFLITMICVLSYIFLNNIDLKNASIFFVNSLSICALILSILSLIYYIRHENK